MNLFVAYVGGKTETSLIEVHDIHFAIGDRIEDTFSQLKKQWWGTPESLHLDAWGILNCVDEYSIVIKDKPSIEQLKKLYFVNLGGYDPEEFSELHKNVFVVADNKNSAIHKAKATISNWQVPHKDHIYAIEDCISVHDILSKKGLSIHLEKTNNPIPFSFTCEYVPIGN